MDNLAITLEDVRALLRNIELILNGVSVDARNDDTFSIDESDILAILKARRNRSQFFFEKLFADPAWDILLELYAAHLGDRQMGIHSLCIGAAVPQTTALRWIRELEKNGLLSRNDDPADRRRVYASLTEKGLSAMAAYFAQNSRLRLGAD